jgi:hypothetical protein
MAAEQDAQGPGPAEFDRIVSRLRAESSGFTDQQRFAPQPGPPIEPKMEPKVEPPGRPTPGDGPFALACLAVIVPMSMVVGGWFGLLVMLTSVVVAARLALHPVLDQQRQAPRPGP